MAKYDVRSWSSRAVRRAVLIGVPAVLLSAGHSSAVEPAGLDSEIEESATRGHNPNPELFPIHSHPYGFAMDTWAENWWRWIFSVPTDQNPFFNESVDCSIQQSGPVFFVPPVAVGAKNKVRSCTVEQGKAIAISLSTVLSDFPCPDPNYHPAPGQSLFDFLLDLSASGNADIAEIDLTLDGKPLQDLLSYHVDSRDLFFFKGDLSLQQSLDSCVTGGFQPAAVDAFFVLFKPLSPGHHTIVRRVVTTKGVVSGPTTTELEVTPRHER